MRKKDSVNINDIARKANVSSATVSRVINQPHIVKKKTRERVQRIIEAEHYTASSLAKQLRMNRSFTIGFIPTSVNMNFYSNIELGIENIAKENGYSVILCNSADDPEQEKRYLNILLEKRVDGIILSPTGKNADVIERITANGIPVCFIDRIIDEVPCDYVVVNNEEATKKAVMELFRRGYSRIGFVTLPTSIMTGKERLEGYIRAHREYNQPYDKDLVITSPLSVEKGKEMTHNLLEKQNFDALFVNSELIAAGALKAIQERGLRIPEDLGFLMWDDPEWTQLTQPHISVISQPLIAIGEIATELLLKRFHEDKDKERKEPVRIVLKTTFIDRGSLKNSRNRNSVSLTTNS